MIDKISAVMVRISKHVFFFSEFIAHLISTHTYTHMSVITLIAMNLNPSKEQQSLESIQARPGLDQGLIQSRFAAL